MRRASIALLAALASALPARAEDAASVPWLKLELRQDASPLDAMPLAPEREAELRAANADYTEILIRSEIRMRADGTQEEHYTQVRRYLGETASEEGGDLEFWVMPSHEEAVIERAYVLASDGSRHGVDVDTIQILPDLQPRVFSNLRRVIVPLPGVTREATAVFEFRKRFRTREWPLPYGNLYTLSSFRPIERLDLSYAWEEGVPAPAWHNRDPALACVPAPDSIRCTREKVPALDPDRDLRAYYDESPDLFFGPKLTWERVATQVRDVVEATIAEGVPDGTLEKLGAKSGTPEERWRKLFDFVANEIRYLGLEHGSNAVVPRAPSLTLKRRYGDCKDKVSLLLALARKAGIDAYAALASTERFDVAQLQMPSTSYFNHMIACRDAADGKRECVDPTVPDVAAEDSALSLDGAALLELRAGTQGPTALARRPYASEIEIEGVISLACDGSRSAKVERKLGGLTGLGYRQALVNLAPQERTRLLTDEYRQIVSAVQTPKVEIAGMREPRKALAISTHATTPSSTPLPDAPNVRDSDVWLVFHGAQLRNDNRHFSYLNPGTRIRSSLRFEICESLAPKFLGAQLDLVSRYGRFQRTYTKEPSAILVNSTFEVQSGRVPPAEIPAFNRFLETSLDQADVWFSLGRR
jgi:hypothetical protein